MVARTPRPTGLAFRPPVLKSQVREVGVPKSMLAGICLTAFSCGIICTVAIYRYAPRLRPDCATPAAVAPADAVQRRPAPALEAPAPQSQPGEVKAEVARPPAPPLHPLPTATPLPAAAPLPAVAPVPAAAPAPAPVLTPIPAAARPAPASAAIDRPAHAVRPAPAASPAPASPAPSPPKEHGSSRGHATRTSSSGAASPSTSPTETWIDPFAQ
jgi:hypothetical protein